MNALAIHLYLTITFINLVIIRLAQNYRIIVKNKIIKCNIQANSIKNENIFIDHNLVLGCVFQQL